MNILEISLKPFRIKTGDIRPLLEKSDENLPFNKAEFMAWAALMANDFWDNAEDMAEKFPDDAQAIENTSYSHQIESFADWIKENCR